MQCGVLSRAQATTLYSRGRVSRRHAQGRWQLLHRRSIITHSGPITSEQQLWAALLAAPKGAALAGWSALFFDGLTTEFACTPVTLLIPALARPLPKSERPVVTHTTVHLDDAVVHAARCPRHTRTAHSLIDAASWSATEALARVALLRGVQSRMTTAPALLRALIDRPKCAKRRFIAETIDDISGGIHSMPEREFADLATRAGLPRPARQAVVQGPDGRYYLDCEWAGVGLAVEVHGIHHREIVQLSADWNRHNELTITGRVVLHFTSYMIRHHPDAVIRQLKEVWVRLTTVA